MTRRRIVIRCFVLGVVLGMFGFVLVYPHIGTDGVDVPASKPGKPRPNIVLIMVDDARVDDLAAMPNTRRLIGPAKGRGARYVHSYVATPLCCPSRATLLTGQYAHNNGVWDNDGPHGGADALNEKNTLPVWLQRGGYKTAVIGKYLNGAGKPEDGIKATHVPRGWTAWQALTRSTPRYTYLDLAIGSSTPRRAGHAKVRHIERYQTSELTDRAVHRIRRWTPGGPMFLWLSYFAPHGGGTHDGPTIPVPDRYEGMSHAGLPRNPAFDEKRVGDKPPWIRGQRRLTSADKRLVRYTRNERRDALRVVDDGVGRVVAALRRSGELRNTVIVFTSDNGYEQGEHRIRGGKRWPYRESARVPLLIRGPGFKPGIHTRRVSNIDYAPTFADLANVRPGRRVDGVSLLEPERRPLLIEWLGDEKPKYASIIAGRWQYTRYVTGHRELYNLRRDPWQTRNRAGDTSLRKVRRTLAARLDRLRHCEGRECR